MSTETEQEYDEPLQSHSPEVLEKLRKLMLVKANSDHEGEAEAALAMAQKIATKHRIDLAKIKVVHVDPISKEPFTSREFTYGTALYEPMHVRYITWLLQEYFGVAVTYIKENNFDRVRKEGLSWGSARMKKFEILGRHSDTEFATYAYSYLDKVFPKLWRKYKALHSADMSQRRSFYVGVYQGIAVELKKAKEEAENQELEALPEAERKAVSDQYALMIISEKEELEQALKGKHPVLGEKKWKSGNIYDMEARNAGFQKGRKIKINRPLEDNKKSALGWP